MNNKTSEELYKRACAVIPGGVNSPVRAFKAVGGLPIFISRGYGSKIYDVDGNEYIDYVLSWGPLILGHAHPAIVESIKNAAELGTSYGAPTEQEIELAELILKAYPSMDKVRLVNSGTEAAMSAIRAARGFTKRDRIIKFDGCYHGHADGLLAKAGSGATTLGVPTSAGVPEAFASATITLPFNDISAIERVIKDEYKNIACVIIEPVVGNSGCVVPRGGFLEGIRELTDRFGVVLIFDEVMTGYRVAYGGAQALYGIKPDMTCLGKVIGGGMPVGAYGGRNEIMSMVSPEGPVYQAGTLSGNPIAVKAGIATLNILSKKGVYERLEYLSNMLEHGLNDVSKKTNARTKFYRVGTMFCQYFTDRDVYDYDSALSADKDMFARFHGAMLKEGVYLAPSQFEAGFMSLAHSEEDIERTIAASYRVLKGLYS
ncbi:glutamate-1-semialdehyde-2,1-aminomutase [Candidatus Magnetoovum chiemensis]|nr:glutamate-1-semialdehyde-2,1-aminomutase [Candidatus Magnetoovum chiemensis]